MGLFQRMMREEWRLHADLFGGSRFAFFPLAILFLTAGAGWLFTIAGFTMPDIERGTLVVAVLFGLHTGTVGLVGRDAFENLLGDVTLLIFSARTLPLSFRKLILTFLAKDLVYYAGLFLLPMVLGLEVARLQVGLGVGDAGWLLVAFAGAFLLGVVLTLAILAIRSLGRAPFLALGVVLGAAAWRWGWGLAAFTPIGFYDARTVTSFVMGFAAIPVLAAVGLLATREAPTLHRDVRTAGARLRALQRVLPLEHRGLVARSLLDVVRSSGGAWKVVFSLGVLFLLTAFLHQVLAGVVGLDPSPGLTFGVLLSLGAFTTYNWITQFDDIGSYLIHPLDVGDIFQGKLRAFVLLMVPASLLFLLLEALWLGPRDLIAGVLLLPPLSLYLLGVTVVLTGFDPSTFLFDARLFVLFAVAVSAGLVPPLLASFLATAAPWVVPAAVAYAWVAGLVGLGLFRVAVPRWTRRMRSGF